jgi:hypothetical protein
VDQIQSEKEKQCLPNSPEFVCGADEIAPMSHQRLQNTTRNTSCFTVSHIAILFHKYQTDD